MTIRIALLRGSVATSLCFALVGTPQLAPSSAETLVHSTAVSVTADISFQVAGFVASSISKSVPYATAQRLAAVHCSDWTGAANGFAAIGASGRELGRTSARQSFSGLRAAWVNDRFGERVLQVSVQCRLTGSLRYATSAWVVFALTRGSRYGAASPRYLVSTIDRAKRVSASPSLGNTASGWRWMPTPDRPEPVLAPTGASYDNQYRQFTVGLRVTNLIYQYANLPVADEEWTFWGESSHADLQFTDPEEQWNGPEIILTSPYSGPWQITLHVGHVYGDSSSPSLTLRYLVQTDGRTTRIR